MKEKIAHRLIFAIIVLLVIYLWTVRSHYIKDTDSEGYCACTGTYTPPCDNSCIDIMYQLHN